MSTITRERLEQLANFRGAPVTRQEEQELARIALESQGAKKIILYRERNPYNGLTTGWEELTEQEYEIVKDNASKHAEFRTVYTAPPAPVSVPDYPDVLPCPVMLEPGLRFGKGVPTKAMLGALQRRSEYYAELDAMTPEQRDEHDAGMREFATMLKSFGNSEQLEPVTTANKLPFEQWLSQQTGTIDVECGCVMTEVFFHWLRVAYEAGNSPVIPDGWKLVPIELTPRMITKLQQNTEIGSYIAANWAGAYGLFQKFWDEAIAAAPKQEA